MLGFPKHFCNGMRPMMFQLSDVFFGLGFSGRRFGGYSPTGHLNQGLSGCSQNLGGAQHVSPGLWF